ncbi:MAG: DUF1097 domain-containing protein [Anaerolineales bacterium]|jgi:hypothetical protein|nr:DUF1097 domain-containing protein [Anaerolineales bacterium]
MKFSKFIIIPLFIAFLAFTMQAIDQGISKFFSPAGNAGFGWIAFQAWAMYFLAGCNIKGGIRTFLGYASGIVASIAIMTLGPALGGLGFWAFPIAVFAIVVPVICLEKVKWLDFVPSIFVGAGVFFGFMSYIQGATFTGAAVTELFYCLFGLVYGYITVAFRVWYEAQVAKGAKDALPVQASA